MPASSGPELLPPALLAQIATGSSIRRFPAHAVLITEGDASDTLFIIVSGRVKVYAANAGGREVILNSHGPGEMVGELALDGGPRSASVMTTEPTSCAVVSGARLRDFIVDHPDFALHLIRQLIARVRGLTGNVKSLALDDVYARVTGLLQRLSVAESDAPDAVRVLRGKLTQQDIADHVGASREMVSRVFKELTRGGYVDTAGRQIRLLKTPPAAW
jgi:CRP/FNR family cyclic AMP-dependent transcriptional regulator